MNKDKALLNKVVEARDLSLLLNRNVNDTWFVDPEDKTLWKFLHTHFQKYGECPSKEVITDNFPNYPFVNLDAPIDYLLDEVLAARRRTSTVEMIGDAIDALNKENNHESALIRLQSGLTQLDADGLSGSTDVDLTKNTMARWDDYLWRKENPGLLGIPTGFPTMDIVTNGLQPGQLIVIVAPPKTGKSVLALQIALNMHMQHKVPMFMSFEMTNDEQLKRYDAMRSRISYSRWIAGGLTSEEESRVKKVLETVGNSPEPFYLVNSDGGATVSSVASKIQNLNPDVVFIDGTYLMIDEMGADSTSGQLTNITRSLKRLSLRVQKPLVITTQALNWKTKNGKLTSDSIGYSSSFLQDADVVFGLERPTEEADDMRILKILAARNAGPSEVSMVFDWTTGQFRETDISDL